MWGLAQVTPFWACCSFFPSFLPSGWPRIPTQSTAWLDLTLLLHSPVAYHSILFSSGCADGKAQGLESVILWFIISSKYLVFIPVPGT